MDNIVKQSIDSRKQAIFNMYDVTDSSLLSKIDDLFNRMYEFGESCDSTNFETQLATSPLNQEYINLFTELSTKCSMKTFDTGDTSDIKSEGEILRDEVASDMREAALDITRPARRQMNQEIYDKVSEIPGASTVMSAKQHFDFFSRFKKRKDDINEEDNN